MAVFVPILSIEEEAGQLFADLALAIAAAVGLSLIVALTVVPSVAAVLYGRGARQPRTRREGPVGRFYAATVLRFSSSGRRAVAAKLALLLVVGAGAVGTWVIVPPAGYLPTGNTNMILYMAQPIPGMRPETLAARMGALETWMMAQPETNGYFLVLSQRFQGGGVLLKDEYATGPGLEDFKNRMMPVCLGIPGFRSLIPIRVSLFRDSGKQFTIEITGPDLEVLAGAAKHIKDALADWPGIQPHGVRSDYVEGQPELRVVVDQHRASEAGMSVGEVGRVVETALAGRLVGTFSDGGRDYDLKVLVPQARVSSRAALATLPVVTPTRTRTTLGALAQVKETVGPQSVKRLERERAITLTVNLDSDAVLQSVIGDVSKNLIAPTLASLPPDYHIDLGGAADKFADTLSALTGGFWLAILITYLLLVALFRSWLSPFVILVTVPLALSGGLLGITLAHRFSANASFDLLSMLGFVILAGIVVNNAILIIHQANNYRTEGMERRKALAESSRTRLRPILMSVTTSVFGMLPLAVGSGTGAELYQGLAAVIVGGLVVSTVFTLFVVPALVSLGWDLQEAFSRAS